MRSRKKVYPYYKSPYMIYPVHYAPIKESSTMEKDSGIEKESLTNHESTRKENLFSSQKTGKVPTFSRPFQRHLSQLMDCQVMVGTVNENYEGRLAGVFSDHLLLKNNVEMHIRIEQIVYVKPL